MRDSDYIIRNYHASDFDGFVRLKAEAAKWRPDEDYLSPQAVRESLGRPGYSAERDLFLVERTGVVVGYIDVAPEPGIGRVVLDCFIHPEHRRKGLATRLLSYAGGRAKALGVRAAHVNIGEDNVVARSVLSRLGFGCVRRFLELTLDMADVRWPDTDEVAPKCRPLQHGEEDRLTEIQNRSFTGSWGYNPNTLEEVAYWTSVSSFSPEDIILAYDGDIVVGYCVTGTVYRGEGATSEKRGRISMLGVDPDYRGRGVGKVVLLAGLSHLRNKGLHVARLTVDSENRAANALYRSVGFRVCGTALWYEKVLD